jgi:hypothetical protein
MAAQSETQRVHFIKAGGKSSGKMTFFVAASVSPRTNSADIEFLYPRLRAYARSYHL